MKVPRHSACRGFEHVVAHRGKWCLDVEQRDRHGERLLTTWQARAIPQLPSRLQWRQISKTRSCEAQ